MTIFRKFVADAGLKWLNDNFKWCSPLKSESISVLKDYLTNVWTNVAMVDYPYPSSFLMPLPGNPVNVRNWACLFVPQCCIT